MMSLQAIDANLAGRAIQAWLIADSTLADLTSEIDAMIAEDMKLLTASPSLDMLHRLKSIWQSFDDDLSALTRNLAQQATSLEEKRARLDQFNKIWQATLQSAKQPTRPSRSCRASKMSSTPLSERDRRPNPAVPRFWTCRSVFPRRKPEYASLCLQSSKWKARNWRVFW